VPLYPARTARAYRYKTGWFYTAVATGDGAAVPAQSDLIAVPLPVDVPGVFNQFSLEVTATAVGSTVRCGIYADDGSGLPGALLREFGSLDSAAATGTITGALSPTLSLPPGLYWVAAVSQGGTPTVRTRNAVNGLVPQSTAGNVNAGAFYRAGITGALPDPFGSPSTYQSNVHKIMLQGA